MVKYPIYFNNLQSIPLKEMQHTYVCAQYIITHIRVHMPRTIEYARFGHVLPVPEVFRLNVKVGSQKIHMDISGNELLCGVLPSDPQL